jgi:hypothetical protein
MERNFFFSITMVCNLASPLLFWVKNGRRNLPGPGNCSGREGVANRRWGDFSGESPAFLCYNRTSFSPTVTNRMTIISTLVTWSSFYKPTVPIPTYSLDTSRGRDGWGGGLEAGSYCTYYLHLNYSLTGYTVHRALKNCAL